MYTLFLLRIAFLYFFGRELYFTRFIRKENKYIWFFIVLFFNYFGYSFYLAYKRRLIKKRVFKPKFNYHNS